ncbi:MAG: hypothetical protein E6J34_05250 [Chloroflexi bacterium]|nr:MAG: hypothetical protein E6J34_05250 [Chloroflexota bacterium]
MLNILLYSQKRRHIFDMPIPSTFSVYDLQFILEELFELPDPKIYQELNTTVSLEYSLEINNKEVPPHKKLYELGVGDRPLITLRIAIKWEDAGRKVEDFFLENTHSFEKQKSKTMTSPYGPAKRAVKRYQQEVEDALDKAVVRFEV